MSPRPYASLALVLAASIARAQAAPTFPSTPWSRVGHVALPAPTAGPLLPRRRGGAAAILGPAGAVAMIHPSGELVGAWGTDAGASPLAWWAGDETLHLTRGRDTLLSYSVDGGLRGSTRFADSIAGGVEVDAGGDAIVSFRGASLLAAARVDWTGAPQRGYDARGAWRPATSAPCPDGRGGVWVGAGAGIVRLHPSERRVALTSDVRALYPRAGGGLIAVAPEAIFLVDVAGAVIARLSVDATVLDLAPRSDGGFAVMLQTSPPALSLYDGAGALVARAPVSRSARSLTVDAADAVLVASRSGELAVFDARGAPRWTLSLPPSLRPPVIALSPTCFAVATEGAEFITLRATEAAP
ncbi:MAG: hypothetical protein R3A48_12115 [Polyangiales bacterium]